MSGFGRLPVTQNQYFRRLWLKVCFHPKRSFKSLGSVSFQRQLTAISGRSSAAHYKVAVCRGYFNAFGVDRIARGQCGRQYDDRPRQQQSLVRWRLAWHFSLEAQHAPPGCALGALAVESTGEELHSPVHFHALEEPGDHRVEIARSPPRAVGERTGTPKHTVVSIGEDPDRKVRVFAVT